MSSKPIDVVRAAYAAFGRGDGAAVLAANDPSTVWTLHAPPSHPYGGVFKGVDGVGRFLGALMGHVDMLEFAPEEFTAEGNLVTVTGRETIKAKSTGKTLSHRWIQLFEVRGGKIVRFEEWYDTAKVIELFRK